MLRVLSVLHVMSKSSEQRGKQNCTFDPSALHTQFEITDLQALAIEHLHDYYSDNDCNHKLLLRVID